MSELISLLDQTSLSNEAQGRNSTQSMHYEATTQRRREVLKGAFSSASPWLWQSPIWKLQVFVSSTCSGAGRVVILAASGPAVGSVIQGVDFVLDGFAVPGNPYGVCSDGTHVWATDRVNSQVVIIDPSNGTVLGTVPVGPDPLMISSDGTHVWVTNWDNGAGTTVTELSAV